MSYRIMRGKANRPRPTLLKPPQKEEAGGVTGSIAQLQGQLVTLSAGMTACVNAFVLLERASMVTEVRLRVPETLTVAASGDTSLMLTDADGVLQVLRGEDCELDFLSTASLKNKSLRNLNPKGVRYPKFLTYRDGGVEFALHRMSEVKQYLREAKPPYTVQRYVVPEGYAVRKTIVHWRRVKQARVYSLLSRDCLMSPTQKQELQPPSLLPPVTVQSSSPLTPTTAFAQAFCQSFALDLSMLVPSSEFQSCEIRKEKQLTLWQQELARTLRQVIEDFGVPARERLEEFLFHGLQSRDGHWYLMDVPCIKVSVRDEEDLQVASRLSLHTLSRSSYECSTDVSTCDPAMKLSQSQRSQSDLLMSCCEPQLLISTPSSDSLSSPRPSDIAFKVRFDNYPKALLTNVIHRVYELVLKDPRLERYYADKSSVFGKVASAVRQVFQYGSSRFIKARMRTVHSRLGVSDSDFDLYVRYFSTALQAESVSAEDVEATCAFLNEFREFVVAPTNQE